MSARLTPSLAVAVAVAVALALASLAGCGGRTREPQRTPEMTTPGVTELAEVEITEYQGEKLDSSDAFRENSIAGVQDVDIDEYGLRVTGLVDEPAEYTYSEVTSGFPNFEKVVQLDCVEGWSAKVLWRGVLVRDILDAAGVQAGARSVIFEAVDGYTTSFPVQYFYDNDILLAYAMNGAPLRPERGFPFQVVAEQKWGYKWCKWVTAIELSAEEDPGGYWEDRGYSNTGDLDKPYYGN